MENIENSPLERPEDISLPPAGPSFFAKLKTKWLIVLGVLGSIAIFAAIIYAVYSFGKRGQEPQPTPTVTPTLTPAVTVSPLLTPTLTPTVSPTTTVSTEGKIAFVRDGDIWLINPDGSGEEKITDLASENSYVPLGSKIKWRSHEEELIFPVSVRGSGLGLYEYGTIKTGETSPGIVLPEIGNEIYDFDVRIAPDRGETESRELIALASGKFEGRFLVQGHSGFSEGLAVGSKIIHKELSDPGTTIKIAPDMKSWYVLVEKENGKSVILREEESLVTSESITTFDLSPDGTKIAYTQSGSLWLYDITSGSKNVLTEAGNGVSYSNPIFSPNGRKIKLDVSVGTGQLFLAFYGLSLNKLDRFGTGLSGITQGISWSADSESVVFGFAREFALEQTALWKMNVVTHEKIELTTNASQPAWAPR